MKLSVSLPGEDVVFLDRYAKERGLESRSAAVHQAVRSLRVAELGSQYEAAWDEWAASEDSVISDSTTADGLGD